MTRKPSRFHFLFCLVLALCWGVLAITTSPGLAQERTTATYDDWTVHCTLQTGTPPQKICDMEQLAHLQGKQTPFSRVVMARPVKGQSPAFVVQVPVNVWLSSGAKIEIGTKDAGLSGSFTYCIPGGCFATINLTDNFIHQFRTANEPAKIMFSNGARQQVVVPLSFKGFGPAMDALAK